jgi:hypothetical protein
LQSYTSFAGILAVSAGISLFPGAPLERNTPEGAVDPPAEYGPPSPPPPIPWLAELRPIQQYEAKFNFVTRSGSQLLLDGKPFRFTGLNIYNASNRQYCWYSMGTGSGLDSALEAIGPGQKVFRTWFFQRLATTNGSRDWTALDHTVMTARVHGQRIIATLGNQYEDCEVPYEGSRSQKTEGWYRDGYQKQRASDMPASYREWVAEVVQRYRSDPTILSWQLINEATDPTDSSGRCGPTAAITLRSFAEDMARLIKGIDPNHLLSLGTQGIGECGSAGADYEYVHSVPGIDLCEYHDYYWPSSPMPGNQVNGLQRRIDQCRTLNKPVFVGETGIPVSVAGSFENRARALEAKFNAQFAAGVVGELVWDWCNAGVHPYSGYEILPGDPALAVLGLF